MELERLTESKGRRVTGVYEDDEAFLRLRQLKKSYSPSTFFKDFVEMVEQALGNSKGISVDEQRETIRVLSAHDPLLWDLAQEFMDLDQESHLEYGLYLKTIIVILDDHRTEILKRYYQALSNYQWWGRVEEKYKKYEGIIVQHECYRGVVVFFMVFFALIFFVVGMMVYGGFHRWFD